jgi:RHH-type proline utilization regulon transcriptional repressor/proline dehydrogenase/delta 1-pyrroline-5-carboxylate dehydrogenase
VVGVQPFGGHGLSGTGPKAGGPMYLYRLLSVRPEAGPVPSDAATGDKRFQPLRDWAAALRKAGRTAEADRVAGYEARSPLGVTLELPGPVGERNSYSVEPRGTVLCLAQTAAGAALQIGAALATGNKAVLSAPKEVADTLLGTVPSSLKPLLSRADDWAAAPADAVLFEGDSDALHAVNQTVAARPGPLVPVQGVTRADLADGRAGYALEWLLLERSVSNNTAAAGGNASLMTIG